MTDILTRYQVTDSNGALMLTGDWVFEPPDLVNDDGLGTAVVLSLFTDRLAEPDDVLPDLSQSNDRRGWWADTGAPEGPMGSRLWLLSREKQTEEVRQRAEFYCREALEWMLEDQVADLLDITAEWSVLGRLDISIAIWRDSRLIFSRPYAVEWQATFGGEIN
jgi:phage gp46-like protein